MVATVSVTALGETRIWFNGPPMTLTRAEPESPTYVAVTKRPAVAVICAVNSPLLASIEPPFVVHVGVIGTSLPYLSNPLAVNASDVPATTLSGLGDTAIEFSVPEITFTTAVPVMELAVAITLYPLAAVCDAVNTPVASIDPPSVLHVGVMATGLPNVSLPAAVKVVVRPAVTVTIAGETVTVVSAPAVKSALAVPLTTPSPTCIVAKPTAVPAVHVPVLWPLSSVTLIALRVPAVSGVTEPLRFTPDTELPVLSTTVAVTAAVAPLWAMRVPGMICNVMVCGTPALNGLSNGCPSIGLSTVVGTATAPTTSDDPFRITFNGDTISHIIIINRKIPAYIFSPHCVN